eukprot:gene5389-5781_t
MFPSQWSKLFDDADDPFVAVMTPREYEETEEKEDQSNGENQELLNSEKVNSIPMYNDDDVPSGKSIPETVFADAKKKIDSILYAFCTTCNTQFNNLTNINHTCRICNQAFCSNCLEQSAFPIPSAILYNESNRGSMKKEQQEALNKSDKVQYLCKEKCLPFAIEYSMNLFQETMKEKLLKILFSYIESNYQYQEYFPRPISRTEDTALRQATRVAQIAEVVATLTGFSFPVKALKYAYFSTELVNALISADLFKALNPLLEKLKLYGINDPSAILYLYYLGCKHTLEYKQNFLLNKDAAYSLTQTGVLMSECPVEAIEYVSRYISAAQFLYSSVLPPPHNDNDWSSWYLSKMISRQKWTLLMCVNEATKLPNGKKCPAFAIIARDESYLFDGEDAKKNHDNHKKEALLIIRGSVSTMDWGINFQDTHDPYTYSYYSPVERKIITVEGYGHSGILAGARTILDHYNVRDYLFRLFYHDFDVKVVGHSLGAGTSVFIAAELRNSLIQRIRQQAQTDQTTVEQYESVHRISAIVFAAPCVISDKLADAFKEDRLLVNIVNDIDVIARYNRKTTKQLATELKEFSPVANEWMEEDKMDLMEFALSVGKATEINMLISDEKRAERYERIKSWKEKQAKAAAAEASKEKSVAPDEKSVAVPESGFAQMLKAAQQSFASTIASFQQQLPQTAPNESIEGTASVNAAKKVDVTKDPLALVVNDEIPEKNDTPASVTTVPVVTEEKEFMDMVCPSPIIHLYNDNSGMMKAAVIDYRHELFQRMDLVLTELASQHMMEGYRCAIDATRHTLTYLTRHRKMHPHHNQINESNSDAKAMTSLFPKHVDRVGVKELPYFVVHGQSLIPSMQPILMPSSAAKMPLTRQQSLERSTSVSLERGNSTCLLIAEPVTTETKEEMKESLFQQIVKYLPPLPNLPPLPPLPPFPPFPSISSESKLDEKKESEKDEKEQKEVQLENKGKDEVKEMPIREEKNNNNKEEENNSKDMSWLPCAVCGLEVTWPSIMHSDASRATATHNCRSCGRIVCTFCAPAGDTIQGDGINTSYTTDDFRLALPWRGLYTPQRICVQCYYDSSYPGLSSAQI